MKKSLISIVDVRVQDKSGKIYHIEVQLINNKALKSRIVYYWAKLYAEQLKAGEDYQKLKPVHSIWITRNALTDQPNYHNKVNLRFENNNRCFLDHCQIHLLELSKFKLSQLSGNFKLPREALRAWLLFLRDGNSWQQLPKPLTKLNELRSAMKVLQQVSEQENNYFRYLGRFMYQAEQLTIKNEIIEKDQKIEAQNRELEAQNRELETQAEYIKQLEAQIKSQQK